ncbi:MAG: hypothetical protein KGI75_30025 [Rhizobiaceae bacterium]|nr:hypothetical protein [Rhizobiaceae bacterium]
MQPNPLTFSQAFQRLRGALALWLLARLIEALGRKPVVIGARNAELLTGARAQGRGDGRGYVRAHYGARILLDFTRSGSAS